MKETRDNNTMFTQMFNSHDRCSIIDIIFFVKSRTERTGFYMGDLSKLCYLPIFRYHPNLSLLIPWLRFCILRCHYHTNPIFCKCASTLLLKTSTSSESLGSGVA